jgi:hypothetical protein
MWEYMVHDDGAAILRCDWDEMVFECYQGLGKWVEDIGGLKTWLGLSSDADYYNKIPDEQAREVMKRIDVLTKKYLESRDTAKSSPIKNAESQEEKISQYFVSELIYKTGEEDHFLEMMNTCIDPKPVDPREREEAVYPYLDELEKVLKQKIGPSTTRDELKRVIHAWIGEKIAQGPPSPRGKAN